MRWSYSKVECFESCPYKYKLRYIDDLTTIPNDDPDNALVLGQAMHIGIEQGVEAALEYYKNSFPVISDKSVWRKGEDGTWEYHSDHITEMIKLEMLIPKATAMLPAEGIYEHEITGRFGSEEEFIGYIDCAWEGSIYDFKYTGNPDRYDGSRQLHVYKHFLEQWSFGNLKMNYLRYLMIPKTKIRQKKSETMGDFRARLINTLYEMKPELREVEYDKERVNEWMNTVNQIKGATEHPKNETRLCSWCEYSEYCKKGSEYMILPKNERREISTPAKKTMWIYGAPFSGKTRFVDTFPDPLMINTDGNTKFISAPVIEIKNEVAVEGRITKTKLAWESFSEIVTELEKKQNDFKTIVVDLLEDVYEACRVFICDRQGWKHESDDSFRSYDMVRTEFLNALKRLMNLNYENIVLISHEDRSKDLTMKGGDKVSSIRPNLQEKVANKVSGMVDAVARVVADDDKRVLSFRVSEVIFGGGRLGITGKEIPLTWEALNVAYEDAMKSCAEKNARKKSPKDKVSDEKKSIEVNKNDSELQAKATVSQKRSREVEAVTETVQRADEPVADETPVKRTRKRRGE